MINATTVDAVDSKDLLLLVDRLKKENNALKRTNKLLTEENEFYKAIYDKDIIAPEFTKCSKEEQPKQVKSLEEEIRDNSEHYRQISDYEGMSVFKELDDKERNAYERQRYFDSIPPVLIDVGMQVFAAKN